MSLPKNRYKVERTAIGFGVYDALATRWIGALDHARKAANEEAATLNKLWHKDVRDLFSRIGYVRAEP